MGTLNLNRCAEHFEFCIFSFGFIIFCEKEKKMEQKMENAGGNLQGNRVQTIKTLIYLQVEVGLNVHPRQAGPGRVTQTEAIAGPGMFLRQKKQDQHFPHQV